MVVLPAYISLDVYWCGSGALVSIQADCQSQHVTYSSAAISFVVIIYSCVSTAERCERVTYVTAKVCRRFSPASLRRVSRRMTYTSLDVTKQQSVPSCACCAAALSARAI